VEAGLNLRLRGTCDLRIFTHRRRIMIRSMRASAQGKARDTGLRYGNLQAWIY
jgi:hypothetical protein